MVWNYEKKTNRQSWSEESMAFAINAVKSNGMGYHKAAETYGVPSTTLFRRAKDYDEHHDVELASMKGLGSVLPVFNAAEEIELIDFLKQQEVRLHGLTVKELRILVYQLAELNHIEHPFANGIAGKDWVKHFFTRNPGMSFRKPEPTCSARAMGFNRVVVGHFFNLLDNLISELDLESHRIFNVDEMGISTVPKHRGRIIATKGRKQVGQRTSGERGELITVELCVNAAGQCLPPLFVFPRKNNTSRFLEGVIVEGSWSLASGNGWMRAEHFYKWLKWFVEMVEPTEADPVALILDGSRIHSFNLDALKFARKNNVHILCLPPHTTHRLQPLDVSLMCPISTNYWSQVISWERSNPARNLLIYDVPSLFCKALNAAATKTNITNGFKATGVWPINRNIFKDDDFMPAEVTNRRIHEDADSQQGRSSGLDQSNLPGSPGSSNFDNNDRDALNQSFNDALSSVIVDDEDEDIPMEPSVCGTPPASSSGNFSRAWMNELWGRSPSSSLSEVDDVPFNNTDFCDVLEPESVESDKLKEQDEIQFPLDRHDSFDFSQLQEHIPSVEVYPPTASPPQDYCAVNENFPTKTSLILKILYKFIGFFTWPISLEEDSERIYRDRSILSRTSAATADLSPPETYIFQEPRPFVDTSIDNDNDRSSVASSLRESLLTPDETDAEDDLSDLIFYPPRNPEDYARGPLFYPLSSDTDTSFAHREGSVMPQSRAESSEPQPSVHLCEAIPVLRRSERLRNFIDNEVYIERDHAPDAVPSTSNGGNGMKLGKKIREHRGRNLSFRPQDIMPIPVVNESQPRKQRKRGKTCLLTSNEHIASLEKNTTTRAKRPQRSPPVPAQRRKKKKKKNKWNRQLVMAVM